MNGNLAEVASYQNTAKLLKGRCLEPQNVCVYDYKKLISYSWGKAKHPFLFLPFVCVCVCYFFSLRVEYYLAHRVDERRAGLKFCPNHGATEPSSCVPSRPCELSGN